jgi:hypothetical protein
MSSRQMARAATDGRRITLAWLDAKHEVNGYLVGMDDFHWLILADDLQTHLIHKSSPDFVIIEKSCSLTSESSLLQETVDEMGRAFFNHCNRTFLGKTNSSPPPCT